MNLSEIKNANIVVAGKKKPVVQKIKAETVRNDLSDALQAVEQWNELSSRTRKAVYAVLAKTYLIHFNAKSGDENEKVVLDVINKAAKASEITFKSNSSLATKIIRIVFKTDHKSTNKYASVLTTAHKENVSPELFESWINERGGIESIRTKKPLTTINNTTKIAQLNDYLAKLKPNHLDASNIAKELAELDTGDSILLFAKKASNQSIDVKSISSGPKIIEKMQLAIYSEIKDAINDTSNDSFTDKMNRQDELVNSITNSSEAKEYENV